MKTNLGNSNGRVIENGHRPARGELKSNYVNGDKAPLASEDYQPAAELGNIAQRLTKERSQGVLAQIRQETKAVLDAIASVRLSLIVHALGGGSDLRRRSHRRAVAIMDVIVTIFCYLTLAYWILRKEQSLAALFVPGFIATVALGFVWPVCALPPRWQLRGYIVLLVTGAVALILFLGAYAQVFAGSPHIESATEDIQMVMPDRRLLVFCQVLAELHLAFFLTAYWRALGKTPAPMGPLRVRLSALQSRLAHLNGEASTLRDARKKVRRLLGRWF